MNKILRGKKMKSYSKDVKLVEIKGLFGQLKDSCDGGDDIQFLSVETADAGGGPYIVISTERWAIDADDIDKFSSMLKEIVSEVEVI